MSSWKCLDVSLVMIDHVQLEGLPSHLLGHDFSQPIMTLTPAGISPSKACLRLLAMSSYAQTCKSKKNTGETCTVPVENISREIFLDKLQRDFLALGTSCSIYLKRIFLHSPKVTSKIFTGFQSL